MSLSPEGLERTTQQIPRALSQAIPQSGRLCNVENPEAFNEAVAALLAVCLPTGTGS